MACSWASKLSWSSRVASRLRADGCVVTLSGEGADELEEEPRIAGFQPQVLEGGASEDQMEGDLALQNLRDELQDLN